MTTTISYMTSISSQHPTEGRLYIHNRTRALVPGSVPYTLSDCDYEFQFNPLLDLSSPTKASSLMSGIVAAVEYRAGPEIADQIATFAFRQVSRSGWFSGLSVWVIMETNHVVLGERQRSEDSVTLG
nr:E3 ubiquitin ligase BIG BROTHER-related-like [Ipomoea batatas]